MKKAKKFDHRIVEITPAVKKLITMYIDLFENQREAAQCIGVSACTINTYNTRSTHIALYVFERIIRELSRQCDEERLEEALDGATLDDIRATAKRQNGAQIDHVMYLINPAVRTILDWFIEPFDSREAGGAELGLNPRTFTAYFKGQISSFPRRYFWRIIDALHNRGLTDEIMFERLGIESWEDILEEKERSYTLQVGSNELVNTLIGCFEAGTLKEKDIPRSVANAAERLFGNLGAAIRAAMKEIAARSRRELVRNIEEGKTEEAVEDINRFERFLALYRAKEHQVNKSLPRTKKINVERLMRPYLRTSQELQDLLSDALVEQSKALYKMEIPFREGVRNGGAGQAYYQYRVVRRYSTNQHFKPGEIIDHPGLGIGEIVSLRGPQRMVVRFFNKKYGFKELVMNGVSFPEY
jgi:hypothetical protein